MYNYTSDVSSAAVANIVSAYDLSDYLCYIDTFEKGFNVTTYFDNFSTFNAKNKTVQACRSTNFFRNSTKS